MTRGRHIGVMGVCSFPKWVAFASARHGMVAATSECKPNPTPRTHPTLRLSLSTQNASGRGVRASRSVTGEPESLRMLRIAEPHVRMTLVAPQGTNHEPGQALCYEDTIRQSSAARRCNRCEGVLCGVGMERKRFPAVARDHKGLPTQGLRPHQCHHS